MKFYTVYVPGVVLALFAVLTLWAVRGNAQNQSGAKDKKEQEAQSVTLPDRTARAPFVKQHTTQDADETEAVERTKPQPTKDSADEIRKREEWFYKQRASANGHIPPGARQRALAHMRQMMENEGKLVKRADGSFVEVTPEATPAVSVTNTWSPIGPSPTTGGEFSPVTGRITAIAIDPADATGNTVLIGGAQGGIWRTTNGGSTWTAFGDQNASLAMGSIAFAPSTTGAGTETVYAGTGEQASIGADIYYGAGVLVSKDSGQTWTQTCTTPSTTCPFIGPFSDATPFEFFTLGGAHISYVSVNPSNASLVLVSAQFALSGPQEGVYCSADGGQTWANVLSGEMSTFVGFTSASGAIAALGDPFGSTTNKNGIYVSTNASSCSMSFAPVTGTGLPAASSLGRIDIGISPNFGADKTLYASIADATTSSNTNIGVFKSTDGGNTWTQTTAPDVCQQQCWYDNVVKVDPNGHVFLGGAAVFSGNTPIWDMTSADGGTTWTPAIPSVQEAGLPHVDSHAMAFMKLTSGNVLMYLGDDGGIWSTTNADANPITWTNLNQSALTLTQFYPALSIHPSSQGMAFAGAQDNGSQIYNQASTGTTWTDNGICGDGTGTAIDTVIPSTVYVACNGINLAVSTQNGAANTFVSATSGINLADTSDFVPPMVTDPNAANTAYAGTTKVYQSTNAGLSWTPLTSDLVNGASPVFADLTAMAVAPGNASVVYAGATTGQLFVATNVTAGAGTFNAVAGQASLPPRTIRAIAIDPADPTGKTAYVAFSGFSFVNSQASINDPTGHLFKTADGGATWTDVSCTVANCSTPTASDLPNTPVNDVVLDPDISGTLYVGTDVGVFQGTCSGTPTTCTWATLSSGLPRVAVLSLKLHHASRTLRAATHGRGVWDLVLNNFTPTSPHISSISPVSAAAGATGVSLTVNGVGLTGGSVLWNGSATGVTTTVVSDTQVTAAIASSLTGGAGVPSISVQASGITSNSLAFTLLGGAPTINVPVSPTSANVNAAATQITVTGTGFSSNAQVIMNPDFDGSAIPTTVVSSTQLKATIPASFIANFGSTNSVGVQNPPPGGGTTVTTQTVTLPVFTVIAPPPANENFSSAINITATTFTDTKDSSAATSQSTNPAPPCTQSELAGSGDSNVIWYSVTPSGTGTAEIDTIGSSYDTALSVWSGTSLANLASVACNDDINPGIILQSQLTNLTLSAGTTYYIMVSSFGTGDPNPIAFGGKSILNFSFTGTIGSGGGSGNFTVAGAATTVTTAAGAAGSTSSGTSTITVTPGTGFTGAVAITCGTTVPGVSCASLNIASGTTTGSLTINVANPSSSMTAMVMPSSHNLWAAASAPPHHNGRTGWWALSASTGLAAILLVFLPGNKKYRAMLGVGLGLACILAFAAGCGGGSSGGGGGGGGITPTTTQIAISGTKVPSSGSITVSATVTGGTPTGSVQFFVDGSALGNAVPVTNGSTGNITVTAANAPSFLPIVGTHTVSAHYLGTSTSGASQSGTLNVTVTGTTSLSIIGTSGGTVSNGTVSLTIN
jgi:hypothetical protein